MDIQMTYFRPNRSPTGPPITVPAATANWNAKRCNWADRHGQGEAVDHEEGEIAVHSRQIEVLREDEDEEDDHRGDDPVAGKRGPVVVEDRVPRLLPRRDRPRIPLSDPREHRDSDEGEEGEPDDARPSADRDDRGGEQGAQGRARVAPHLEDRLREAAPLARGHVGDARSLGMEDRRAQTDEADREKKKAETLRQGQGGESDQGEHHAAGQGIGLGLSVRYRAHDRLEERGGELVREGDESYLGEVQVETAFDEGIDRGDDGLHGIVEKMRDADRDQYREYRRAGRPKRRCPGSRFAFC